MAYNFFIDNCQGIFDIHKIYTNPRSFSPFYKKAVLIHNLKNIGGGRKSYLSYFVKVHVTYTINRASVFQISHLLATSPLCLQFRMLATMLTCVCKIHMYIVIPVIFCLYSEAWICNHCVSGSTSLLRLPHHINSINSKPFFPHHTAGPKRKKIHSPHITQLTQKIKDFYAPLHPMASVEMISLILSLVGKDIVNKCC